MKLLLLDLDDTLLQDLPVSRAVLEDLGRKAGVEGFFARVKARAEALFREAPFYPWAEAIGHSALEALWARYSTPGAGPWPPGPGLSGSGSSGRPWRRRGAPERARELAEAFFRERRRYPLYPEAEAFLAEARRRGLALALLTNGVPDLQREKLVGAGLAHHFSLVLISGEVGIGKPDPRLFRMALCAFGVAPEEAAMVGDNPQKDVRGARLAGVRAVWVDRGLRPEDPEASPDLRVGDLREVFLAEAL